MVVLRFFLIAFNIAIVAFLIYRLLLVARQTMVRSKRILIVTGGVMLLLAPVGMFVGIFAPTLQYFIIYPVAISLFLYLTKQL